MYYNHNTKFHMNNGDLSHEQQKHNDILSKTLALFFENDVINEINVENILNKFNIDVHYRHELLLATAIASENYMGIRVLLGLGAEPKDICDDICKFELDKDYVLMVDGICRSFGKTFNLNDICAYRD